MKNRRLASALSLFDEGYAIFPVVEDGKAPLVAWTRDWATERSQVEDHWSDWPGDNIGINCEQSALLVVDLDGQVGIDAFTTMWLDHEARIYDTRWSTTPNHGRHVWFDMPYNPAPLRNSTGRLALNIDTRGAGGLIVGPGSQIGTRFYELENDCEPKPMPEWLEKKLRAMEPPLLAVYRKPEIWPEGWAKLMLAEVPRRVAYALRGRRNAVLNKEAWRMRSAVPSVGLEVVQEALLKAAQDAGLPEYEARRTIRSGLGC